MKLIAIIPARTGSKRLPNKNFRLFFSRFIVDWVAKEIDKSELFDKQIISTDKPERFKHYMSNWDIIERRSELCSDTATVDEVCLDVLEKYPGYDYLCCVYPTAYAVTWQDLCKSFSYMLKQRLDACCSFRMLNEEYECLPDNGGFYWIKVDRFLECKKLVGGIGHLGYYLPMVDINTIQDFAEAKIHALTLDTLIPGGRFK